MVLRQTVTLRQLLACKIQTTFKIVLKLEHNLCLSPISCAIHQITIYSEFTFGLQLVFKLFTPFCHFINTIYLRIKWIIFIICLFCWSERVSLIHNEQYHKVPLCCCNSFINHLQDPVYCFLVTKHNHSASRTLNFAVLCNIWEHIFCYVKDVPSGSCDEFQITAIKPFAPLVLNDHCYDVFFISILMPHSVILFARLKINPLCFRNYLDLIITIKE